MNDRRWYQGSGPAGSRARSLRHFESILRQTLEGNAEAADELASYYASSSEERHLAPEVREFALLFGRMAPLGMRRRALGAVAANQDLAEASPSGLDALAGLVRRSATFGRLARSTASISRLDLEPGRPDVVDGGNEFARRAIEFARANRMLPVVGDVESVHYYAGLRAPVRRWMLAHAVMYDLDQGDWQQAVIDHDALLGVSRGTVPAVSVLLARQYAQASTVDMLDRDLEREVQRTLSDAMATRTWRTSDTSRRRQTIVSAWMESIEHPERAQAIFNGALLGNVPVPTSNVEVSAFPELLANAATYFLSRGDVESWLAIDEQYLSSPVWTGPVATAIARAYIVSGRPVQARHHLVRAARSLDFGAMETFLEWSNEGDVSDVRAAVLYEIASALEERLAAQPEIGPLIRAVNHQAIVSLGYAGEVDAAVDLMLQRSVEHLPDLSSVHLHDGRTWEILSAVATWRQGTAEATTSALLRLDNMNELGLAHRLAQLGGELDGRPDDDVVRTIIEDHRANRDYLDAVPSDPEARRTLAREFSERGMHAEAASLFEAAMLDGDVEAFEDFSAALVDTQRWADGLRLMSDMVTRADSEEVRVLARRTETAIFACVGRINEAMRRYENDWSHWRDVDEAIFFRQKILDGFGPEILQQCIDRDNASRTGLAVFAATVVELVELEHMNAYRKLMRETLRVCEDHDIESVRQTLRLLDAPLLRAALGPDRAEEVELASFIADREFRVPAITFVETNRLAVGLQVLQAQSGSPIESAKMIIVACVAVAGETMTEHGAAVAGERLYGRLTHLRSSFETNEALRDQLLPLMVPALRTASRLLEHGLAPHEDKALKVILQTGRIEMRYGTIDSAWYHDLCREWDVPGDDDGPLPPLDAPSPPPPDLTGPSSGGAAPDPAQSVTFTARIELVGIPETEDGTTGVDGLDDVRVLGPETTSDILRKAVSVTAELMRKAGVVVHAVPAGELAVGDVEAVVSGDQAVEEIDTSAMRLRRQIARAQLLGHDARRATAEQLREVGDAARSSREAMCCLQVVEPVADAVREHVPDLPRPADLSPLVDSASEPDAIRTAMAAHDIRRAGDAARPAATEAATHQAASFNLTMQVLHVASASTPHSATAPVNGSRSEADPVTVAVERQRAGLEPERRDTTEMLCMRDTEPAPSVLRHAEALVDDRGSEAPSGRRLLDRLHEAQLTNSVGAPDVARAIAQSVEAAAPTVSAGDFDAPELDTVRHSIDTTPHPDLRSAIVRTAADTPALTLDAMALPDSVRSDAQRAASSTPAQTVLSGATNAVSSRPSEAVTQISGNAPTTLGGRDFRAGPNAAG